MPEGFDNVALDAEGERILGLLGTALSESKYKNKSIYTTWLTYFTRGAGEKSKIDFEAMLTYWLSWYVLASDPEDGLNPYVFSLANRCARGEKLCFGAYFS